MAFYRQEDIITLRTQVLGYGLRPVLDMLADVIEDLSDDGIPIPLDAIEDPTPIDRCDVATACDNLREPMF